MNATMVKEMRRLYETRLRFLAACLEVEVERLLSLGEAVAAVNRAALALYTRQKCPPERRAAMRETFFGAPSGGPEGPRKAFDGDWIARRVKPCEGDAFDFGVDYSRCAIVDLYRSRGAERFLPYLCANDYAVFEELGLCLDRTETIGNGASRCDFRFRREGTPRHVKRVDSLPEFSKRA